MDLKVEKLCFSYGKNEILRHVTFDQPFPNLTSIVGPTGSGKSTLLRILVGLLKPTKGSYSQNMIGYMPQTPCLLPWKTVKENLIIATCIANQNQKILSDSEVKICLDKIGLRQYADQYPASLSGGMAQRVSFLRAMLSPHPFLCLDEPFSALDAFTRFELQQWLLETWKSFKKSILLVTHHIEEAIFLSHTIHVFSQKPGRIIKTITVDLPYPRTHEMLYTSYATDLKRTIYSSLQSEKSNEKGC